LASKGDEQAAVVDFLLRPATHGAAKVERIDTHGAVVFLAGERAYKLKRAVKFSYMDFSTPALRRRACEAEVALNRRTAPSLYLGVRAIHRDAAGRLSFGEGQPVDWLVVMRRFPQEDLFDRMAERGALSMALVLDLAGEIARFHAAAEPAPGFGGRAGVGEVVRINAENLVCDLFERPRVRRLVQASEAALERCGPLLDERKATRVRRCHGDLHLANVCLVDGRPTLFDCIEFAESIACIDVLYDVAFLLMDLWHRRMPAHANAVLNRYFDSGGEETRALGLLPLFLSLRAAVRAHVGAATLARQPMGVDPALLARRRDEARAYLALAERLLKPPPATLIAVGGLSGTGKSTLAYGLAPGEGAAPGARVLRSDAIRKRLFGVAWQDRLPEEAYGEEMTARVYGTIRDEALAGLGGGHAVIADAVFARAAERRAIADAAAAAGTAFRGFWLEAPAAVLEQRVRASRADASDATIEVLRRQLAYDVGPVEWTRLDASVGAAAALAQAQRILAAGPAALTPGGRGAS